MIAYLEQLEQDLVEAIDRREAGVPVGPRPRRRLRTLAIVLASLAAGILIGIAIRNAGDQSGKQEVPAKPPVRRATPTPPPPRNIGSPNHLRFVGELLTDGPNRWRGSAAGTGIPSGTLTITGRVEFRNRAKHVIRWRWLTPRGTVAGCITNTMFRSPRGRWVWDGVGHITQATGKFARWHGKSAGIAGRTYDDERGLARIILSGGEGLTPQDEQRLGAFDC